MIFIKFQSKFMTMKLFVLVTVCQNMKRIIKKRCDDLTKNLTNLSDDDEAKQKADKTYKALCRLYYEKMAPHLLKMKVTETFLKLII